MRGKLAVVVGGGGVAERKTRGLLAAGARVRVVASEVGPGIREAAETGALELRERRFEAADVDGALLVFAATPDPAANAAVAAAARARDILIDEAGGGDTPGDFATPFVHRAGSLTFAIDGGSSGPWLAMRLVKELRESHDVRYARAAETLGRARDYAKAVVPEERRADVLRELAARDIDVLAAMHPSVVENEVENVYAALVAPPPAEQEPFVQLVCATRASALAMWQTRHVMAVFAQAGLVSTVLQISTKGDRVQDRSLAALGTDSIFVKELELALRDGRADYAVHSCKDLPSTLPEDMLLAAIGPRADPRDAFCSERYASFEDLPAGAIVGTSSPRRRAQLQALRPDLRFETIRGNVETRLRKLGEGEYDAILLAMAGLQRLELRAPHTVPLPVDVVIPAVGQGALAIETRASDPALAARIGALFSDRATEIAVRAERAFLRTLRGGCQAPVGAFATFGDGELAMRAAIAAPDGSKVVRGEIRARVDLAEEAEAHAEALAHRLLGEGGAALLDFAADRSVGLPLAGHLFVLAHPHERPSQIAPALRGAGAEVIEVASADDAALALGAREPDALLFPSSGAVHAIAAYLAHLRQSGVRPLVATMGGESSDAAREAGFPPDVVATEATVGAFVHGVTHFVIERQSGMVRG